MERTTIMSAYIDEWNTPKRWRYRVQLPTRMSATTGLADGQRGSRYRRNPMRTLIVLATAVGSLDALGCGVPCDDSYPAHEFVFITMHLPPLSAVAPPETVVVSSPIQASGTLPIDGYFNLAPRNSPTNPFGSVSTSSDGTRLLQLSWNLMDADASSPPDDQFDVTVTDAAGTVEANLAQTGQYIWNPPGECNPSGYWSGPDVANDGGTDAPSNDGGTD
jgi:hypothetical protein